ncbi:MAG: hypothetical protein N2D54_05580 [Chloroflexota bacterium]
MDNGMIRKHEKAKIYAEQRDRIAFKSFEVSFDGTNNPHTVTYKDNSWHCDCDFFIGRNKCSHTMALDIILDQMVPEPVA